jgi:hypothetical protein
MQNTDSLRDEVRLQREKLKGQPFSKKWEYYWGYYKVPAMIIVFCALIVGSIIHSVITRQDTVLSVAYINAFPNVTDEAFMEDFDTYLGLNTKKETTVLDSTYYIDEKYNSPYASNYEQKFSARAMAGELDVVVADEEYFTTYGEQGFFQDLRLILSEEELAEYGDRLFYLDVPYDDTEEKVPVGINVTDAAKIVSTDSYPSTTAYLGIVTDSSYVENALSFLAYLEE